MKSAPFPRPAGRPLLTWWFAILALNLGTFGFVRAADDDYPALLTKANALLKDGKLDDAFRTANAAIALDDKRFEGYFVAGAVARQQGRENLAKTMLETALDLAPDDKRAKIQQFIVAANNTNTAPTGLAAPTRLAPSGPSALDTESRRKLDVLLLIPDDADKAPTPEKRIEYLEEFLAKSTPFLREHPDQVDLWVLRAVAAMETGAGKSAKRAGQKLQELGYRDSSDEKFRKVFAMLDRRGWLVPSTPPEIKSILWPQSGKPFENSFGMKFVPIPGLDCLFSIWDTRNKDFIIFAKATELKDSVLGVVRDWGVYTGARPGSEEFELDNSLHPAKGVTWQAARDFCEWLTTKEQSEGKIGLDQVYRLPTDAEWSLAAGIYGESGNTPAEKNGKVRLYSWGTQWPPPDRVGNFQDKTVIKGLKLNPGSNWSVAEIASSNYNDDWEGTAPVGTYPANKFGLYDMSGNVRQWCDDWYDNSRRFKVLRGSDFNAALDSDQLQLSYRNGAGINFAGGSGITSGFRCVLDVKSSEP